MRDNDNYDYKHLIDRITDALGVTDDALRCRLCFASAQTDRIADGTYVMADDYSGYNKLKKYPKMLLLRPYPEISDRSHSNRP